MIEARELTERYGDTTAVHSVSFTISPGTVTGFLGPNGAGRSTTMRMIMGLARPTPGTVTVKRQALRWHPAAAPGGRAVAGSHRQRRRLCLFKHLGPELLGSQGARLLLGTPPGT